MGRRLAGTLRRRTQGTLALRWASQGTLFSRSAAPSSGRASRRLGAVLGAGAVLLAPSLAPDSECDRATPPGRFASPLLGLPGDRGTPEWPHICCIWCSALVCAVSTTMGMARVGGCRHSLLVASVRTSALRRHAAQLGTESGCRDPGSARCRHLVGCRHGRRAREPGPALSAQH
jgi:hypothetical protein